MEDKVNYYIIAFLSILEYAILNLSSYVVNPTPSFSGPGTFGARIV